MSLSIFEAQIGQDQDRLVSQWQDQARSLCKNPTMIGVARWFAESFLGHQRLAPRAASIFTTQQKWLLAHLAASLYLQAVVGRGQAMTLQRYVKAAVDYRVASRNTARDFFLELLKYNFSASDGELDELMTSTVTAVSVHPTQETMVNLQIWYQLHLHGLDMLDGGDRHVQFSRDGLHCMTLMEPFIAHGFLTCPDIRNPGPAYKLFSWVDEGGLLMDRFISDIDPAADLKLETIPTGITSVAELARGLNLTRVHASRVVSRAEKIGALGWTGPKGRSSMWISRDLHEEYVYFQALKMVIVGDALSKSELRG
jgi:hypothetical protein